MKLTRPDFLLLAGGAPLVSRLAAFEPQAQTRSPRVAAPLDILILNARIVDDSGAPAFLGDIAVKGDHIAAVGQLKEANARVIDAGGQVACPGGIVLDNAKLTGSRPGRVLLQT
jgi:hypothetical protein